MTTATVRTEAPVAVIGAPLRHGQSTCEQPSYTDPMHWCKQRPYGSISPGSVWTLACFHHYGRAARMGWLVKR